MTTFDKYWQVTTGTPSLVGAKMLRCHAGEPITISLNILRLLNLLWTIYPDKCKSVMPCLRKQPVNTDNCCEERFLMTFTHCEIRISGPRNLSCYPRRRSFRIPVRSNFSSINFIPALYWQAATSARPLWSQVDESIMITFKLGYVYSILKHS